MAGMPRTRKQLQRIVALGPEGEEQILAWLATGVTTRAIAERLGLDSTRALYKWRNENEVRKAAWAEALRHRAEYLAEQSLEIADRVPPEMSEVKKAELQVRVRQWLAAVSDPDRFQPRPKTAQEIRIEHFHLTAVREINAEARKAAEERLAARTDNAAVQGADYEFVDAAR